MLGELGGSRSVGQINITRAEAEHLNARGRAGINEAAAQEPARPKHHQAIGLLPKLICVN
jgi:hypothetical protein